jgi:hypothetical protein
MKAEFAQVAPSSSNNPRRVRRILSQRVGIGLLLLIVCFVVVRSCSYHSPTIDILGSYFPAWMVCILSGVTLTLIAHWIVQVGNLKPYIGPAPLIYPCQIIIFTFVNWIVI